MKMFYAATSPFARKCMVVAHETGLADRIEKLPGAAHPVNTDANIVAVNPLGQVPTFITDDGQALFDSRVICEYLDELGQGAMFPRTGAARWRALTEQSLADGILDAAILARYEGAARPEEFQWSGWTQAQMKKIHEALDYFEKNAETYVDGRVDIGVITLGCALGYLDFRFAHDDWRATRPKLSAWLKAFGERPSMRETAPHA
ncbi:glutathione S-transferase [Pusillimonas sp. ANT_WB101]|uniref:glutathione S-transferase n=1 Tax=Pusillimonas sp. ANT_WB101 TaxID=2597356 RepID=UPI0011EF622D|nr:glutathione S-transferase [Pusillimonas sp. ANT_WB101]KAA0892737.1 glutathione S-transferase [Pusillimonas sp. ANT_WB101]